MNLERSKALFEEAKQYIPGGVNSPVRAFKSVGGTPLFISRAKGSKIYDADGNEYIDYVGSWGPMILGHAHPNVVRALRDVVEKGTSYGAPTELEIEMAKLVVEAVPSIEKVRFVSSGTEAVMSAIRLARGYTGREKIVKFEGCYHGHSDSLLVKAGSGLMTLGIPGTPGVTEGTAKDTIVLPYNDLESVKQTFEEEGENIACVIIEPIAGNMGVVPPEKGFLEGLRELTTQYSALLIFDEVITGFRVSYGGAQELFGIYPDLTTLGKIIGGGLPVGAFGGRAEIMDYVAPEGPVYQAGTLSGNPLAMAAGIAVLKTLKESYIYDYLERMSSTLAEGLKQAFEEAGVPAYFTRVGSMMCAFFTESEVKDYASAATSDTQMYSRFFWGMIEEGCYFAPSQFEAAFVSTAHTELDVEKTIDAAHKVLKKIK
ncbi:MAG: glutamate-1-semialdehyde 2,1-aminomutase [Actinobacteria bacterium]|nr:glutamate-1-semialdehyde 2,1-aminomutase [Actinomycetota bacterium]